MVKKLAIIDSENKDLIFSIEKFFTKKDVDCRVVNHNESFRNYDLVVLSGFNSSVNLLNAQNILNIYPSLLPAFICSEPIKDALLSGVKVSGVTIHKVDKQNFFGTILAQYPVLIGNDTRYTDLKTELLNISKKLYPIVIEAVLNDKVFDFSDLYFKEGSCSGGCSLGCPHSNSCGK